MTIEEYWIDSNLYYVEFISLDERRIQKELIFPVEMTEELILDFIKISFVKVKEIKYLDFISEVLIAKE